MMLREKVALWALPTSALAVTLSDFKSQSDSMIETDLPPSCRKVYKAEISGCSPSDFTAEGCSEGCVAALQLMGQKVESACGDEDLEGTGILTVFLNGNGPGAICPGAAASAGSGSSESKAPETTTASSISSPKSTFTSASSQESSSTATSKSSFASLSGTVTASSLAPTATAGSILVDTSSIAAPTSTSTVGGAQSGGDDHSGQGSPFDSQGISGSAIAIAYIPLTMMLLTAATMLHAAL